MPKVRLGPDGIHIFSRDTGLNVLIDEDIPPKDVWTSSPRQISISLTNACDLECSHCYAPKKTARLSLEVVKQWMLELDDAGCFGVGFGGGEPTIHPNLLELCHFGRDSTDLAITMTTHAHRFTVPMVMELKQSINFLRISMDGVRSTYEKIRGRSFASFLEKLKLVRGQIPFGINFVVNEATICDLPDAITIAEEFQATEFLLLPEEAYGRGTKVKDRTLDQLSEWISGYRGAMQLSISSHYSELVQFQAPLPNERDEMSFAHINAEGILKRNSFEACGLAIGASGVMDAYNKLIQNEAPL